MQSRTPLLRPAEAAALLRVSTRTLRRYLDTGELACCRLPSGHVRITEEALDAMLERGTRGTRERPRKASKRRRPGALVTSARLSARRGRELFDTSPEALAALRATCRGGV